MLDYIPDYTGEGERVKNPKEIEYTTSGIKVGGKIIDPELLYRLAQWGASNVELADFFGTNESQIRYYFNEYLSKARASLKLKLRRAQLKVAIENENPTLLIWLGKNILGQSDTQINTDDDKVLPWNTEDLEDYTDADTTQTSTDNNA